MNQEHYQIEKAISQGLADTSVDLIQDFTEMGLDEFVDNPVLKEVPFVKAFLGLAKGVLAIREIHFAKKLFTFFKTFHRGDVSEEKRLTFLTRFNSEQTYRNAVVEQTAVLNDRFISEKKSEALANLLRAHVNLCFDWEEFVRLAETLDSLPVRAFERLKDIAESPKGKPFSVGKELHSAFVDGPILLGAGVVNFSNGLNYHINYTGMVLYQYGILGNPDYKHTDRDLTAIPENNITV